MIGFKVIDTKNGNVVDCENYYLGYRNGLYCMHFDSEGSEGILYCSKRSYKAVPSITIDGVECYVGQIVKSKYTDKIGLIMFGEYNVDMYEDGECVPDKCYGFYCNMDGRETSLSGYGEPVWFYELGNVWQPEFSHLKHLIEV